MQCIVSKNVEKQGHLSTRTPTSTTQTLAELRVKCAFGFLRVHVSQTLCWNYFILFYFSLSLFPHLFIFPLLFFFSSRRERRREKGLKAKKAVSALRSLVFLLSPFRSHCFARKTLILTLIFSIFLSLLAPTTQDFALRFEIGQLLLPFQPSLFNCFFYLSYYLFILL